MRYAPETRTLAIPHLELQPFSGIPQTFHIEAAPYSCSNYSHVAGGSMCILVYRLQGLDRDECVSRLVYGHLKAYFPSSTIQPAIHLIEIELNLRTESDRLAFAAQQLEVASNLQR